MGRGARVGVIIGWLSLSAFAGQLPFLTTAFAADSVVPAKNIEPGPSADFNNQGVRAVQGSHWLTFRGKPFLPIGDSVTQGWMECGENFDQRAYLDALAKHGLNTVLLWAYIGTDAETQRADPRIGYDAPEIWPWKGSPDGASMDLRAFNPAYFKRLRDFAQYADSKDIVVVITVQDGWTKTRFGQHPFNAALGNGPLTDRGQFVTLADYNREMPAEFDESWTWQEQNQYFQERFAEHLTSELSECTNVIFEMFNEGEWYDREARRRHEEHFLAFFRKRTKAPLATNLDHVRSSNFAPRENPNVDILSFHGTPWTGHFERFQNEFNKEPVRVLFETEPVPSYGWHDASLGDVVLPAELRAAVWERVLSGAGWVAQNDASFAWDPNCRIASEVKLRGRAYKYAGHAARFFNESRIPFWAMRPIGNLTNSGICLASPGKVYVLYVPEHSLANIDLSGAAGDFVARFYNPRTGEYREAGGYSGGANLGMGTPGDGDWILCLRAVSLDGKESNP